MPWALVAWGFVLFVWLRLQVEFRGDIRWIRYEALRPVDGDHVGVVRGLPFRITGEFHPREAIMLAAISFASVGAARARKKRAINRTTRRGHFEHLQLTLDRRDLEEKALQAYDESKESYDLLHAVEEVSSQVCHTIRGIR